jgi:ParB family chromosome partitioning protein
VNGTKKTTRGLGRGLDALLPGRSPPRAAQEDPTYRKGDVFVCPVEKLRPQRGQPRRHFDGERLDELAQSIKEHGVIEPLVVRRVDADSFEIIAGERRWRAAQRAGLTEVYVVVRDVSPRDAFELALIENIQREDLNPIEFAEALDRLLGEHGYTQDSLAQRLGKDRSTLANALRLLRLPDAVRERVVSGELSEGHARALLGVPDDAAIRALSDKVVNGRLSVRQTEALVRQAKDGARSGKGERDDKRKTPSVRDLEHRLARKLGARVTLRDRDGKGEIVIGYASLDELDRLLELLL